MAKRFYLGGGIASPLPAQAFHANWEFTTGALRRKLLAGPEPQDALTTVSVGPWTATNRALFAQWISAPLQAITIAGTVKCQLKTLEGNALDNVFARMGVRVISNDGSTERGVLLAVNAYALATEFSSSVLTNRIYADGDTVTSVAAQAGDRLLVELGATDVAGVTPDATCQIGAAGASDLPEDATETGAMNGWIEFSDTILMQFRPSGHGSPSIRRRHHW